ncbi:alpha/beta hydrolase family protein [Acanthopleuribacter pedis]|uniref:Alpha/beta fold hydrolase n=1 Tax=Acanthopleuribacter pedis TaxID=442870 RepID=A0A8J7U616_9BACT|nr:alpha/beta fold hydrolase [Acanthopleuribacter pedis]MBO1321058.1 alpha/beta fold hydrolase [Acanthopleuribacter pedis]
MKSEKITFPNTQGHQLAARVDLPDSGAVRASALFAHCFTCSKNLLAVSHIARALTAQGIAVFRFDFTGLGDSEGDFAATNFSTNLLDLAEAARHMADIHRAPQILIGHSLGGAAVIRVAKKLESVRAVVTIGAPADPQHVAHLVGSKEQSIRNAGEAEVHIGGRPFTIRRQFLDDLAQQDTIERIGRLGKALLVCHAPMDNTVGIENAAAIFGAAKHPKSFLSLDQADHLLSKKDDAVYVGKMIAAWAERYVD